MILVRRRARILQIVRDAGIPHLRQVGVRGRDDLIATMAQRSVHVGAIGRPSWSPKTKDLRQMLHAVHAYVWTYRRIWSSMRRCSKPRWGTGPAEAVEVQSLMGDAIDNIPGIPGHRREDGLQADQEVRQGLMRSSSTSMSSLQRCARIFEKYAANIPLARSLVTLRRDVPMGL